MSFVSCPPNATEDILNGIRAGRRAIVPTHTRVTVIDAKCLAKFEALGLWLLKADGHGYRLRSGKGNVYLVPGQLQQEAI